LVDGLIDLD